MSGLIVENICLSFGELRAINNVSFKIEKNEILSIIGPNGAGKTSLLNCISGYYKPQEGEIIFNDINLKNMPIYERTKLGIARTFQNVELFNGLTALDNILAARHLYFKTGILWSSLYFGKALKEEVKNREMVEEIIDFLEIKPIRKKNRHRTVRYEEKGRTREGFSHRT